MKALCLWLASTLVTFAAPTETLIADARDKHGPFGEKAARFLVEHMPESDRETLSADFLIENLDLAMQARKTFPWARQIPEEIFLNDVLPYAVFDEPRDPWRADFLEKATPLVADATTATEAAQALNKEFFKLIKTHYHTERRRTNQSPEESIEQGRATCTGLAIILVDACRAVGVPARAVGTPMWTNGRGNHTWVEIWDDGWHFTGADEYNPQGLNRGWFTGDAAKADATRPEHGIYATTWRDQGLHFPMVWAPRSKSVPAVDVTSRYAAPVAAKPQLGVRFFDGDERIEVPGVLTTADGGIVSSFRTKAGTTDLNDMPRLDVSPGESYRLRFKLGEGTYETETFSAATGETTLDVRKVDLQLVKEAGLSAADARETIAATYDELVRKSREARAAELEDKAITIGDKTLKWLEKTQGRAPRDGRSLWISMHGGGGAPAAVNDRQWLNQIRLYEPEEGIYVAPRAPTDTWNLWHQNHIDPLFSRLIENMVALRGVDPNKVYLLGYSAGGDGVWQLAPRMADRFAAAAMMAGHPNESSLLGLRNLPFAIYMGGDDSAHNRSKVAVEKAAELEALREADPAGYPHRVRIYEGVGHWMNREDAEALPWMKEFTRDPWPEKIVWFQDDVTHQRFYWLHLPDGAAKVGMKITATIAGQTITLDGDIPPGTRLLLHDDLLDLNQPIEIVRNGGAPERHEISRDLAVIQESLATRLDPAATPTAEITLD